MQARHGVAAAVTAAAVIITSTVCCGLAYWPGVMTWDSIRQYDQALSGEFDDWHPPLMEWIWRELHPLLGGPAPMLVLQLGLYAAGFALLAGWAIRRDRPRLGVALAFVSLTPVVVALMGEIIKDSLMAAMLLSAAGLIAWGNEGRRVERRRRVGDIGLRLAAAVLIVLACALRFNAFLAGGPLLAMLLPQSLRDRPVKGAVSGAVATGLLLLAAPAANHLLKAERSGVELSLVIFDLGGITAHGGGDAFPQLPVRDPVAANRRCYSPVQWDKYADWAEEPCAVGFQPVRAAFGRTHTSPTAFWIRAILAHPIAYAEHRLQHFNINSRFLVRGEIDRPVHDRSEENDWKIQTRPSLMLRVFDGAARRMARTPLGWPITWMAVALGLLVLAPKLATRGLVAPLALSSLLYGLGYGVVSVSSELRYHLWTTLAALVATLIAAADLPEARARLSRRDGILAATPVAVVVLAGVIWRLLPA